MSVKPFRLQAVGRSFGSLEVFRDLTLDIEPGEFVAIVGPSGCGKTTLLNLMAGFDRPTVGKVESSGRKRMVFQQDGLFPWLTVSENVALGLRDIKDKSEQQRQIEELLRLIRLEDFGQHYPHQLSGGMRQRVELARALAGSSDILLMDEPFSALDYLTRLTMRQELARLLAKRPRTVVLVTHDIEEAAQLADRVLVLSERPARIQRELRIPISRPRNPTQPGVVAAIHTILTELDIERDAGEFSVAL
jgi:NitT/TauT family transport system ATP-binding protein